MPVKTISDDASTAKAPPGSLFYRAVWRWHFYAGLYVIPFMLTLAITGLIMLYGNSIETPLGKKQYVNPGTVPQTLVAQGKAAANSLPEGKLVLYVAPPKKDQPSRFIVKSGDKQTVVAVDPASAQVLGQIVKDETWYYFADQIHGTLLLGKLGDALIEIAAGFGIVLVVTGLYLWWPRRDAKTGKSFLAAIAPRLPARGRALWKELHGSLGFCLSIILLLFLLSGMSWTGVWGAKFVQAWSSFPAEKWDNVPLSDKTHVSMNHGAFHEVPWALEQTAVPASGSQAGLQGIPQGQAVNLDSVAALAGDLGFRKQFRINLPDGEEGVYTISADSMDHDTDHPWQDRTIHVDQYTGKILADINFKDYSLMGKAMAVGIALHQGDLGWWNIGLNSFFCLSFIFLSISGLIMWIKRRPRQVGKLLPPPRAEKLPLWPAALLTAIALGLAFPLMGAVLFTLLILDALVVSRVPKLKHLIK